MKTATAHFTLGLVLLCLGAASKSGAESGCRHDAPLQIAAKDGLLSLEADNICLGDILNALVERGYAKINFPPSLTERPVSVSFDSLPPRQAIKHVLKDTNYVLQIKGKPELSPTEQNAESATVEIWLIEAGPPPETMLSNRGQESIAEKKPLIDLAEVAEQSRSSVDPEVRAYAVQLIAQSDSPAKAAELIIAGLQDPAPKVRSAALIAMAELDPALAAGATDLVTDIALHDQSPELRKQALLTLVNNDAGSESTAKVVAEALKDENPEIRTLAQELSKLVGK